MSNLSPNKLFPILLLLFNATGCKKDGGGFSYDKYYASRPDIQNCVTGSLNSSSKEAVLARVNYIRSLHKLPAVVYNTKYDELAQQSALIGAANAELNHYPATTSECFSKDGALGSSTSNLGISLSSDVSNFSDEKNADRWLTEEYSETIGHRRWLLDPFLKYVSYGRVDGKPKRSSYGFVSAVSLKVINNEFADITYLHVNYVAYPYADYPTSLFLKNGILSFSVLYDNLNEWNNSYIKYTHTVVEVTSDDGHALLVSAVNFDNQNEGLPNSIQWKADGLKDNITYTVKIKNVEADGNILNYQYTFRLIK
ncbi:CAP domain-containing protein [Mucilaginibacter sp.]|uniref:CAP domain-containing protein n=1 Tax=Mucilaginibacter sp. TaxID=1882438 RepID=UPI0032637FAD